MNRLAALLFLVFTNTTSFAQKEYLPEFLIPYNHNGLWGWCDTMGKIIIEPQFQQVSFFSYKGRGAVTVVEAGVKTSSGYNTYSFPDGLVVPVDYSLINELYNYTEKETRRWFSVQGKDGKLGIFESTGKNMVVKPEWDVIEADSDFEEIIYLKREREKFYFQFDRLTNKSTKTDIDSIFYTTVPEEISSHYFTSSYWFFKHLNGNITKLVDGKHVLLTPAQKKSILSKSHSGGNGYGVAMTEGGDFYFDPYGKTFDSKSRMLDTTTCMIGLIQFPGKTLADFKEFRVIRENGKIGIYDNHGILILPFVYDKIKTQNDNKQVMLYSGDKVGMKLFFTNYKTVEPKYDSIEFHERLRVNSRWSFLLYKVTLGDKKGFIGENGAEYFHFD